MSPKVFVPKRKVVMVWRMCESCVLHVANKKQTQICRYKELCVSVRLCDDQPSDSEVAPPGGCTCRNDASSPDMALAVMAAAAWALAAAISTRFLRFRFFLGLVGVSPASGRLSGADFTGERSSSSSLSPGVTRPALPNSKPKGRKISPVPTQNHLIILKIRK